MSPLPSQSSARKAIKESTSVEREKTQSVATVVSEKPATRTERVVAKKAIKERKKKTTLSVPRLYWRLVLAGFLGPLLLAGIFLAANKLKELVKEIEQKRGQLVALSERETSFKEVESELRLIEEEASLVEKAMPNEEKIVVLLGQIEELKKETGIEIKVLDFAGDQPQTDAKGNSYIELLIEAHGSVTHLKDFLERFLTLPVLLETKMIDLTKADEPTSKLVFRAWIYIDPNFFLE